MKKGQFFTTSVATIAAGQTYTTLTPVIDVSRAKRASLQAIATGGNAGSSGTITFHLAAAVGDVNAATMYSTSDLTTVTVDVAGTTAKRGVPILIDCDGMSGIVCTSIVNGDGLQAVTLLNIRYGLVERDSDQLSQSDSVLTGGA